MFEKLPESGGGVIGLRVSGRLTDDDYKGMLIPELERTLAEHGKVALLVEFADFHGWDLHAAWDDMSIGLAHRKDFTRMAVVDAPDYVRLSLRVFAPFFHGEFRSFTSDEMQAAWEWARQS